MSRAQGGSATAISTTTTIAGTVTANQGTSPWVDNISQIGGAPFSLGQQLAATSLPVVLTAAQLSTLTPLSTVAATQSTSPWVVSNGGTFAVQAALNAETTKVIGTVNIAASQTIATVTTVSTVTAVTAITNALPTGTNSIGNVGHGKTCKTVTGSASATFTIVAAVSSKKLKVYSLSLMSTSTTAVTVTFKDAAAGTAIGTYLLQAPAANSVFGIVDSGVTVPSFLFATSAGNLLEMSFSAAVSVTYNLRYWDDDAS